MIIFKPSQINYRMLEGIKKRAKFYKISHDIKSIKIQGARNVARKALEAYFLFPSIETKRHLLSLRPTEPMLENVLEMAAKGKSNEEISEHFDEAQEKINKEIFKLLKSGDVVFTHCHSTNVSKSLIYSKHHGKNFEVYNTETRPLYQGRLTAEELTRNGIKVTLFVDSALRIALTGEAGGKKVDKIFLGADALVEKGVINKVGSGMIARIAQQEKIPVYIVADSWKFTNKHVPIEMRKLNEVWGKAPRRIRIKNPAFEFIPKKFIKGIVSDLGVISYDQFVKKARKINDFQK